MISASPGGAIVDIRVIPRAKKSEVAGTRDHWLLVRLKTPPVDGKANTELVRLLAAVLDVPRQSIQIVAGERSRGKRVRISGRTAAEVKSILSIRLKPDSTEGGRLSK
jgi:uncharacterized protein (TIGR00251 family)